MMRPEKFAIADIYVPIKRRDAQIGHSPKDCPE
jgi:hypothetical protein